MNKDKHLAALATATRAKWRIEEAIILLYGLADYSEAAEAAAGVVAVNASWVVRSLLEAKKGLSDIFPECVHLSETDDQCYFEKETANDSSHTTE